MSIKLKTSVSSRSGFGPLPIPPFRSNSKKLIHTPTLRRQGANLPTPKSGDPCLATPHPQQAPEPHPCRVKSAFTSVWFLRRIDTFILVMSLQRHTGWSSIKSTMCEVLSSTTVVPNISQAQAQTLIFGTMPRDSRYHAARAFLPSLRQPQF